MTAATLTRLPLAAGGLLAHGTGRVSLWALTKFLHRPFTYLGVAALICGTAMTASNALYRQTTEHPSPFFGAPAARTAAIEPARAAEPTIPMTRPTPAPATTPAAVETPRPAVAAPSEPEVRPIGNEDVAAVQQKLLQMRLFDGEVDGYYGPRTARAIRAFELQEGMRPRGELTPSVVEAILRAQVSNAMPVQPAPQPVIPNPSPRVAEAPAVTAPPSSAPLSTGALAPPAGSGGGDLASLPPPATEPQRMRLPEPDFSRPAEAPQVAPSVVAAPAPTSTAQAVDGAPNRSGEPVDMIGDAFNSVVQGARQIMPEQIGSRRIVEPQPDPLVAVAETAAPSPPSGVDPQLVTKVQRGLASLGFLTGAIDGVAGEGTGKAIRNFEVYHNYPVTGRVYPELVDMLLQAGAVL